MLETLGCEYEAAYVFGSSGGAIVGLDLAARYPKQIQALIAHEPSSHLLPEADPIQEMAAIREVYLREGIAAAFHRLAVQAGLNCDDQEPNAELLARTDENRE